MGEPHVQFNALYIFAVAVGVAVAPERHAIKISINNYYLVVSFSLSITRSKMFDPVFRSLRTSGSDETVYRRIEAKGLIRPTRELHSAQTVLVSRLAVALVLPFVFNRK